MRLRSGHIDNGFCLNMEYSYNSLTSTFNVNDEEVVQQTKWMVASS